MEDGEDFLLRQIEAERLHGDFQLVVVDEAVLVQVEEVECFADFFALLLGETGERLRVHGGGGEAGFARLAFALETLGFESLRVLGRAGEGGGAECWGRGAGRGAVESVAGLVGRACHGLGGCEVPVVRPCSEMRWFGRGAQSANWPRCVAVTSVREVARWFQESLIIGGMYATLTANNTLL